MGKRKIQLGQTGLFGNLPNIIAGALEVEILTCYKCGKVEFYRDVFYSDEKEPEIIEQVMP
ncbi:MAG: hypothetical protein FWG10_11790 [Eubacteriaceae bacterium]|nr:hypothetical protein [Eubacteriaceae bacterium]